MLGPWFGHLRNDIKLMVYTLALKTYLAKFPFVLHSTTIFNSLFRFKKKKPTEFLRSSQWFIYVSINLVFN